MHRHRSRPSTTGLRARCIAVLLLVVQGLVALSPLVERRADGGPPAVHAEQHDAQHPNQHNDATCALCSARAATMAAPVPVALVADGLGHGIVPATTVPRAASPDAGRDHPSRAPPASLA